MNMNLSKTTTIKTVNPMYQFFVESLKQIGTVGFVETIGGSKALSVANVNITVNGIVSKLLADFVKLERVIKLHFNPVQLTHNVSGYDVNGFTVVYFPNIVVE